MTLRRSLLFYGIAGCVIYVVALVATIPAPWLSDALARASGDRLQLRDPSGSVWTGSGRLYASVRSGALLELGALRWKTSWTGALLGRLEADVLFGEGAKAIQIRMTPSSTTLRSVNVELPGSILGSIAPGLEAFGPRGTLRIRTEDLRLDASSVLGLAEIEWRQVRLARAPGLDLGSHVARLRGGGSKVDIELGTLEGALRLSGRGTWTRETGLSVSGAAEHGPAQAATLGQFLNGICSEYREGRCAFRVKL